MACALSLEVVAVLVCVHSYPPVSRRRWRTGQIVSSPMSLTLRRTSGPCRRKSSRSPPLPPTTSTLRRISSSVAASPPYGFLPCATDPSPRPAITGITRSRRHSLSRDGGDHLLAPPSHPILSRVRRLVRAADR
ncbi:hypothetical protein BDZ89DRAFT_367559 [Hymenopellis radicata]|nr:hypothetical protein BDZ89DRAFT_367559 [Hymenopellis radicata]